MANRPPRFPGFSYTGFNRYFLTICTDQRARVFRDIAFGQFVADQFLRLGNEFGFEIIAYCVMPDHLHVLAAGQSEASPMKPYMDRSKQITGYEWKHERRHRRRLWQESYHDRVLRDSDSTESVVRYILENPVRAGLVDDARDYPLIGSTYYDVEELLLSGIVAWKPPWK